MSQPEHSGSPNPPAELSQHPRWKQGTCLKDEEDVRNRNICWHEGYAGKDHYMSDKICRAEEDLKLTGEINVEPGNINFPLGGLLLQMLQFSFGFGGISF
jgi:hypothetical protein